MDRISATVARRELTELLNRVAYSNERLCLTRHGKDVACVVSMKEVRLLDLIEERRMIPDPTVPRSSRDMMGSFGLERATTGSSTPSKMRVSCSWCSNSVAGEKSTSGCVDLI